MRRTSDRLQLYPIAFAIGFFAFSLFGTADAQMISSLFVGGGLQDNLSKASIEAYDGSTACGVFTSGSGTRPSFFAGALLPKLLGPLDLRLSASFDDLSTAFLTNPDVNRNSPLAFRLSDHSYVPIDRERSYDARVSLVALHAAWSIQPVVNSSIEAGFYAGMIAGSSYTESERILSPSAAVFDENHLTTREIGSGSLLAHPLQAGIEVGLHYSLHFQRDLWLEPGLGYRFPFTSVSNISTSTWRITPLSASLSLAYHVPESEVEPIFTVHTWDSLIDNTGPKEARKPLPVLAASLAVLDSTGRPILDPQLDIERTHVLEVFPMLHYVFFDDGSSDIPVRYDIGGEASSESQLAGLDALEIHHHILDIIGKRLADRPSSTITMTGTRSEHSVSDSAIGAPIATARARTVAQYLQSRWKISSDRIKVLTKSLPDAASDDRTPAGQAENRRVELSSNDPSVTAPVITERIERTATPPTFIFQPLIASGAGVKAATLTVRQGSRILMTNDALTGATSDQYLWTLNDRSMPDTHDSLIYELTVLDSTGQTAFATGSIHLAKSERDRYLHRSDTDMDRDVHRYSLILFDYSSSQPDKKKADALMTEMAKAVADSSRIQLTGHTDQTGDDDFNEELARQRVERAAEILAKHLAEHGQAGHPIEIESHGSRDRLFDNSLPEGRLLSRTVRAFIEQDIK